MNKAFVTGSTGFLGKHFLEKIKLRSYLFNKGGKVSACSTFKPDYIFHFAGEIYNSEAMVDSNIILTHDLLEEARKLPNLKAFIYIGSSSEYGRKDHAMSETDYLDPTNMYEATKGSASLLCQAYARQYGVPAMVARPFSLYGKYEPKKRFIPTIINSLKKRHRLFVSPGVHDFIHVDDFIDGLMLLAENPKPGEIYNFGTGTQTSNDELVGILENIIGTPAILTHVDPLRSYDSDMWVSDCQKAHAIGWKPKLSLYEGLTRVVNELNTISSYNFNRLGT